MSKKKQIVFILVFLLGVFVFSQDKQINEDKKLRKEILAVYKSSGEQGLRDFVKKRKDKISNEFIVGFAKAGRKERKEDWLKVCEIMAEEKKDEKTLADVYLRIGEYSILIFDNRKALNYLEKAFSIYVKKNNYAGQANIYWNKGSIYFKIGNISRASEMYESALNLFKKVGNFQGQANVYFRKGDIYFRTGKQSFANEMYEKALLFFEKIGDLLGHGNVYLRKGDIYFRTGDHSKALSIYENAQTFYEKAGNTLGRGNIYKRKGDVYSYIGNYSKSLKMYDKALPFFEKAGSLIGHGNIYLRKGAIYLKTGVNSKALEMYEKALPFYEKAGDPIGVGNVYMSKGEIYSYKGKKSKALEMYDKALLFFGKSGSLVGQGNVHLRKGAIYVKTGVNSKALEMYDKALSFFEKAAASLGRGEVYLRKGIVFFYTGYNSKALEMYDKALYIFEKVKAPLNHGNLYLLKGDVYLLTGDHSRSLEMYDKALLLFEKVRNPMGQGNVYGRKGDIFLKNSNYSKAIEMYDKALVFSKSADEPIGQGNVYRSKGDIYLRNGDYSKALKMYDKALTFFINVDIQSESYVLYRKAKSWKNLGKEDEALILFEKTITNLEKVRTQTAFSEMKRTFIEKVYTLFEEATLFMLENRYYDKAFKYMEAMKARVFLDQMVEGMARLEKGLKPESEEQRDNLVTKLSYLSKEIHKTAGEKNDKKLQELKEKYLKVENEFEDLLIKIRLENPLYASVRYPQPISVKELQKEVLKQGEILVRYFISPDKLYVFLISKKKFKVVPLEVKKEEIKGLVEQQLRAVKENDSICMKRYGKTLYKKLFKPLEKRIKKSKDIIIVPDGELATIPFESLILNNKEQDRPVFLLEKYRVKYLQSASLLKILRQHYQKDRETNSFIGFGDPVYDYKNFKQGKPEKGAITRSSKKDDEIKEIHRSRYARAGGIMDRLLASGEEVKAITRLFEKKSQRCVTHLRDKATEGNAGTPSMKDFDFIHFACHGLLNDDFQSLVLSQDIPDAKDDGYFTLNEIMNCDYNAKLVVLSACQTGSGKMERAEGVTGLTRAFMYAGTPAVVASLWKVDDTATKELMINFYQNMLEKNLDKAEALRQAKLALIKNKKYRSPLFWSAFVLYGE